MDIIQDSLALFQLPYIENSIQKEYWVEYNPMATISEQSVIEFNIPGTSMDYIDLRKSKLCLEFRLTKADGSPIVFELKSDGSLSENSDQVGPINYPLNTFFRQIDVSLNQKIVSPDVGVNHACKTIIDMLLKCSSDMIESQAQAGLFYKDAAGNMDDSKYDGSNGGYIERIKFTKDGNVVRLEGPIYNDFMMNQKRLLLNGVAVNIKLFQAGNNFRLMSPKTHNYKVAITNAVFKVCQVAVNPSVILAHDQALAKSPAIYPFWRSDVKSFTVATGGQTFMIDNIYHGNVPSKIILAMVSNKAYSGDMSTNPFNFLHKNVNYLEISVDGTTVPHRALKPNFSEGDYLPSYFSLIDSDYHSKKGIIISAQEYPNGYSLFLFDLQSYLGEDVMSNIGKGHVRLNLRFQSALDEPINILVYAKFPDIITIDQSRQVVLQD